MDLFKKAAFKEVVDLFKNFFKNESEDTKISRNYVNILNAYRYHYRHYDFYIKKHSTRFDILVVDCNSNVLLGELRSEDVIDTSNNSHRYLHEYLKSL